MPRLTKREQIEAAGFEVMHQCREDNGAYCRGYRVRCNSCQALSINGRACHERGCPNAPVMCGCCGGQYRRQDGHACPEC